MYQALYRTYRPDTFEGLLGQEHIVRILKNQLAAGTTSHAYLFSGTRGTGKTTVARILAKGLNCIKEGERPCGVCPSCIAIREGKYLDVIEIDAASNNGVENIRELRESVKYPPALGPKKVYIIDEVHMLSPGAFNALLKTLEEPPEYVVFVLATTELQKLPATILSRCLRLDFRRVPEQQLRAGIQRICREMDVVMAEEAAGIIAAAADGSARDCLSLLDQCIAAGSRTIEYRDVLDILGTPGTEAFIQWTDHVLQGGIPEALRMLDRLLGEGKEVRQLMKDWIAHYRNLMLTKFMKEPGGMLNLSGENIQRLREQSQRIDMSEISEAILRLSSALQEARWSTQPRVLLEMCIVLMAGGAAAAPLAPASDPVAARIPPPAREASTAGPVSRTGEAFPGEKPPGKESPSGEEASHGAADPSDSEALPDPELLWHRIFEDGETMQGSYNLIRTGTTLQEIRAQEFVVMAASEIKRQFVLDNKAGLERLMEKHLGRFRTLRCIVAGETAGPEPEAMQPDDLKERKARLENAFNIRVEIE